MLITITGKAGSGKSTAAKALAEKLGYEYISIGSMKRIIAQQMGLSILEFNELGERPENQKEFDFKYEDYQKSLDPKSKIVLESRLGFFCQPKSFKIFLTVDEESAAKRIFKDKRSTDNYISWEEVLEKTKIRDKEDVQRYQKLYGVDYSDHKNYDLIYDSTDKTIEETVADIIKSFDIWKQKNQER
ncbi:MAG: cytidylate kinase family protein [Candidatus Absconditabacteria bacterium]|nr:cytidylate kinase family protein [Candidatus Absconditabacteria bacterium]